MSEADLPVSHGVHGLLELTNPPTDGDSVGCGIARHVAVEANPVDRTDEAVLVVRVGGGKFSRLAGEGKLHQVDHMALMDKALTQVLNGRLDRSNRTNVLRRKHKRMVQTYVRHVKRFTSKSFWLASQKHSETTSTSTPTPTPSSQPVLSPRVLNIGRSQSLPDPTPTPPSQSSSPTT